MNAEREKYFLDRLARGVVEFDEDNVRITVQEGLAEGLDPQKAIFEGLLVGMQKVGELYEKLEYFVPELLMCSDALNVGLDILKPLIKSGEMATRGKILLGVVQGDVHDIGKNIVKMMLETAGFEVHDLGHDVASEQFIEEQLRTDSDIVAISAMMTTTMMQMKWIIKELRDKAPQAKVLIGGAPVTEAIAKLFGADGYGKDASHALKEASRLMSLNN
jgi:methanogenic corrinoid protein MtbC1